MFAYCVDCGYDSGDFETREELKEQIETEGGHIAFGGESNNEPSRCPRCGSSELRVD